MRRYTARRMLHTTEWRVFCTSTEPLAKEYAADLVGPCSETSAKAIAHLLNEAYMAGAADVKQGRIIL